MPRDPRVIELLLCYEEMLEKGLPVTPEKLCSESPELLDELRRGIADLEAGERRLTPPATDGAAATVWSDAPVEIALPLRAGRYEVEGLIAEGGMGAVWRARDPDLKRALAIKVLRLDSRGRPELMRRFLEEAQVTGQLQHPGIPPVHEVGTLSDGRPFFAMKLIKGQTLAEVLGTRRAPGADLPRLLGIFEQVCQAVAYAHSKGVIHRDLKPSNVMVGAFGEVQVMDWGLAKILTGGRPTAEERQTASVISTVRTATSGLASQAGAVLGTYAYMAPEQARGEVNQLDERCDVFGLGAILCEILTGQPPYSGGSPGALALRAELGPALERLGACGADGELVALARRCLALDPPERPRDAGEVAAQVAAYQAAVQERLRRAEVERATAEAQATQEARTRLVAEAKATVERRARRLTAGLAVAILLLLATVTVGSIAVALSTAAARRKEAEAKAEADRNFRVAIVAVEGMLKEADEQLADAPLMETQRRELLRTAAASYETFLERKRDEPGLRKEMALAHKRLADSYRLLGQHDEAKRAYGIAIVLLTALGDEQPAELEYRNQLADAYAYLGEVHWTTDRLDAAQADYSRALEIQLPLAAQPDKPDYRKQLARIYQDRGLLLRARGQPHEAEKSFKEAISLLSKLVAEFHDKPDYRQHLARAYLNMGPALVELNRTREAETGYHEAIRLQQRLVDEYFFLPNYRYELGVTYINLGYLLEATKRYADAEKALGQALDQFDKLAANFPNIPVYRKEKALTLNNLGLVLARLEQWPGAEATWRRALDLYQHLAQENPVPGYEGGQGMVLGNLGWARLKQQDSAGARPLLEGALDHVNKALEASPQNPEYLDTLRNVNTNLQELADREAKAR